MNDNLNEWKEKIAIKEKISMYVARLLSACCFYLFLAKANTWLNTTDNTILAFGYRFFILLAPVAFLLAKRWITFIAFFSSTLGVLCWLGNYFLLGTILFSSGLAIGGYVLKYHASKTPKGAASNRIALNMGVFIAGLVVLIPLSNKIILLMGLGLMLITLICSLQINNTLNKQEEHKVQKLNFSFSQLLTVRGVAWAMIGVVIGIKLMSTMSVLPQYLLGQYGEIPSWYGLIIAMSSLFVVLLQMPIMLIMQRFSLFRAFFPLIFSMILIAFPGAFYCETMIGGVLWTFALTVFECSVSYLDVYSVKEGTLLIKEFFVGIGMAVTVLFMRGFDPVLAACLLGIIGICFLVLAMQLLKPKQVLNEGLVA